MKIKDTLITAILVVILIILVVVLFTVKANLDNKNNKSNNETNGNTITIKYDSNGGNYLSNSEVTKGNSIALPVPVREGYKFLGWYVDGKLVDGNTKFDSNTILVAKWLLVGSPYKDSKVNTGNSLSETTTITPTVTVTETNKNTTFKITFDTKGGSTVSSITVKCNNDPINLPEDPTKEGYKFNGWVDKNNNPIGNGSIISCSDMTFYATWEKEEVKLPEPTPTATPSLPILKIIFDTNGGTAVDNISSVCLNQPVTLPTPTKPGYTFLGWFDDKGNEVVSGGIICGELTLHAKWGTS